MLFEVEGVIGFLVIALWIWALVDCITTDADLCRNLPKGVWLLIVLLLFDIGSILWLLLGRPANKHWRPVTGSEYSGPRRAVGVEDRQGFQGSMSDRRSEELDRRLAAWEAERGASQHPSLSAPNAALDAKEAELAQHEADLRRRELEQRQRELDARERDLDES